MAAEKYPTLSYSLRIYYLLISYVSRLENEPAVKQTPSVLAGVNACKNKLLDFFDQSTFDSEYYYFATSKLLYYTMLWIEKYTDCFHLI
jgi:hypothetical protein